jgi:hypothetical protein
VLVIRTKATRLNNESNPESYPKKLGHKVFIGGSFFFLNAMDVSSIKRTGEACKCRGFLQKKCVEANLFSQLFVGICIFFMSKNTAPFNRKVSVIL